MPIARVQLPDGRIGRFEVPEGTTPEQATKAALEHFNSAQPTKPALDDNGSTYTENYYAGVGRGMLGAKQALIDEPAAALADTSVGKFIDNLGQWLGLPSTAQANANTQALIDDSKKSGADRLVMRTVGGNVGNAASNALAAYTALSPSRALGGNALIAIAGRGAPVIGAVGSGATQGYIEPIQTGDNRIGNTAVGAAAGLGSYGVLKGIGALGGAVANKLRSLSGQFGDAATAARKAVDDAIDQTGINIRDIGQSAYDSIRKEVENAIAAGRQLDADALSRKVDIIAVGGKPTLASVTRDPQQFAKEKVLAGIDGAGAPLADAANQNNSAFINTLNKSGASKATDSYTGGKTLIGAMQDFIDTQSKKIGDLYSAARDSAGRPAALDPAYFSNRAADLTDKGMVGKFIPQEIKDMMNGFSTGQIPFDVQHAEIFKTIVGNAQRSTQDGNAKAALGMIRQALDETPLLAEQRTAQAGAPNLLPSNLPTNPQSSVGQDALDAFNKARQAYAKFRSQVDSTPGLSSVDKADNPGQLADKFFNQHVINAPVEGLKANIAVWQDSPAAMDALKTQTLDWLKNKALSGASDEIGKFSQSAYNKALVNIGDKKLGMIFSPDEVKQLKTLGRAASYVQANPAGAAVNSSNTASQVANLLMAHANPAPLQLNALMAPLRGVTNTMAANRAAQATLPGSNIAARDLPLVNRLLQMGGAGVLSGLTQ